MKIFKAPYLFLLVFFFQITLLKAEGTKQLAPNASDRVFIYTNSSAYNNFGRYDGADDQRLYIHINDPESEQLFIGLSQSVTSGHHPCNSSVGVIGYFRIKDPTGRVVFPVRDSPNGQILDGTTANINSYAEAVAGPEPIVGITGYTPFVFDPTGLPAGDYYIEFSKDINVPSLNNPMHIERIDLTVATKTLSPTAIDGRVFSRNWALFAPSPSCGTDATFNWFDRPFNGQFFVYTDQNIVTQVDFQGAGFQPAAFNVVFNDAGTTNIGDVISDRKSLNNIRSSNSQHQIFLNDPDINIYPSGVLGEFTILPLYLTCDNGTACVEATITEPGQIDVLVDLDRTSGDFIYDIGSADVLIAFKVDPVPGEVPPYKRCVPWDGRDGFGNKLGGQEALDSADLLVRYTQGIYHFPIYDAEYMLTGFDVTTIRPIPNNGSPKKIYYDDTNIPDDYVLGVPEVKINPFNGCNIPCHPWTNREFGDLNTINTWFFAREETEFQIELGGCPMETQPDSVRMFVNTTKDINVLGNDLGTENIDTTSIMVGLTPLNGSATFDSIQLIANYTPTPEFIGLDSFTYVFCYGILPVRSLCDSAKVYVIVEPLDEDCMNMLDDDGDGLVDCNDPDCQTTSPDAINRKKQENLWWIIFILTSFGLRLNWRANRQAAISSS